MVGQSAPAAAKLYDNSIMDGLIREGFIERLYKGEKS
jgi:hypothetical protein